MFIVNLLSDSANTIFKINNRFFCNSTGGGGYDNSITDIPGTSTSAINYGSYETWQSDNQKIPYNQDTVFLSQCNTIGITLYPLDIGTLCFPSAIQTFTCFLLKSGHSLVKLKPLVINGCS